MAYIDVTEQWLKRKNTISKVELRNYIKVNGITYKIKKGNKNVKSGII